MPGPFDDDVRPVALRLLRRTPPVAGPAGDLPVVPDRSVLLRLVRVEGGERLVRPDPARAPVSGRNGGQAIVRGGSGWLDVRLSGSSGPFSDRRLRHRLFDYRLLRSRLI